MKDVFEFDDRDVIPCAPDRVFNVLLDVRAYYRWWPKDVTFEMEGEEPMARPGTVLKMCPPFMQVWARVLQVDPPSLIIWDVFKGDYVGSAQWTVAPLAQATELAFIMRVRANSCKLRLSSYLVDVPAEHSEAMQQAFAGLKRHLR